MLLNVFTSFFFSRFKFYCTFFMQQLSYENILVLDIFPCFSASAGESNTKTPKNVAASLQLSVNFLSTACYCRHLKYGSDSQLTFTLTA